MAAAEPQDPVQIRHIVYRSSMIVRMVSVPARSTDGPTAAEALGLVRAMKACSFRSSGPGCGCAGGRCALRLGALVSHLDCFDCLRRYPDFRGAETRRD
jgi:hypothetical protein